MIPQIGYVIFVMIRDPLSPQQPTGGVLLRCDYNSQTKRIEIIKMKKNLGVPTVRQALDNIQTFAAKCNRDEFCLHFSHSYSVLERSTIYCFTVTQNFWQCWSYYSEFCFCDLISVFS